MSITSFGFSPPLVSFTLYLAPRFHLGCPAMEKWLSHGQPTSSKVNLNPIVTAVTAKNCILSQ